MVRYDFVKGLNESHISKLSYIDDINRNKNAEASRRARISSENWAVLSDFEVRAYRRQQPPGIGQRMRSPCSVFWLAGLVFAGLHDHSEAKTMIGPFQEIWFLWRDRAALIWIAIAFHRGQPFREFWP